MLEINFNIGIVLARDARSTENGSHISRNCIDLKHTNVQFELKTIPDVFTPTIPVVGINAKSKHVYVPPQHSANVKYTGKANLIKK